MARRIFLSIFLNNFFFFFFWCFVSSSLGKFEVSKALYLIHVILPQVLWIKYKTCDCANCNCHKQKLAVWSLSDQTSCCTCHCMFRHLSILMHNNNNNWHNCGFSVTTIPCIYQCSDFTPSIWSGFVRRRLGVGRQTKWGRVLVFRHLY